MAQVLSPLITEAPLPDPTQHPETDPKRTPKRTPKRMGWDGRGVCRDKRGGVVREKKNITTLELTRIKSVGSSCTYSWSFVAYSSTELYSFSSFWALLGGGGGQNQVLRTRISWTRRLF